jgi:hypothetical protein
LSTKTCVATEKYGTANNQKIMTKRKILSQMDSTIRARCTTLCENVCQ